MIADKCLLDFFLGGAAKNKFDPCSPCGYVPDTFTLYRWFIKPTDILVNENICFRAGSVSVF